MFGAKLPCKAFPDSPGNVDMSPHRNSLRWILRANLFATALLSSTLVAAPPNRLLSEQEVFTFIADTIDWYRHLPNAQQIGTEPADLLFLEDNRPITAEVARLAFQFGKNCGGNRARGEGFTIRKQ